MYFHSIVQTFSSWYLGSHQVSVYIVLFRYQAGHKILFLYRLLLKTKTKTKKFNTFVFDDHRNPQISIIKAIGSKTKEFKMASIFLILSTYILCIQ